LAEPVQEKLLLP